MLADLRAWFSRVVSSLYFCLGVGAQRGWRLDREGLAQQSEQAGC